MQVLLLQEIVGMMSAEDEAEIKQAIDWIIKLKIEINNEGEETQKTVIELDKLQRYMLLKLVWRST
jgi:hypothetical protein